MVDSTFIAFKVLIYHFEKWSLLNPFEWCFNILALECSANLFWRGVKFR